MPSSITEIFNDSFERCTSQPGFFEHFYAHFLATSPNIAALFKQTNFTRQKRLLKSSLLLLMMYYMELESPESLHRVIEAHDRYHYNITPELYDQWLTCLLETVKAHDPYYDATVEAAWRAILEKGIVLFKQGY